MKSIRLIILLLFPFCSWGNTIDSTTIDELLGRIMKQEEQISVLGCEIQKNVIFDSLFQVVQHRIEEQGQMMRKYNRTLKIETDNLRMALDTVQSEIQMMLCEINEKTGRLGSDIVENRKEMAQKAKLLRGDIKERTMYGIVAFFLLLFLASFVYYILHRRVVKESTLIEDTRKMQLRLQEESVRLDNKLLSLLDKQLEFLRQSESVGAKAAEKTDHSLVLKVADEITRIEINLSRMDTSVKGYKQLSKAVERIKENFFAKGYEIVPMLGKPFYEGMKVVANFVPDENLNEGEQIITGIIKPQINYNGQMIQAAQITVSQNI